MGSSRSDKGQTLAEAYPISVVIPTYNAEPTLKACLQAILKNDLSQVEILVADDASTDKTVRLAESFESVKVLSGKLRQGPAGARNLGTRNARNPWILFLDADVIIPSKTVEWMRESLQLYEHRSEVVGVLGTYSEEIPQGDFLTNFKNLTTCYLYEKTDTLSPFLHTPMCLLAGQQLEEAGGFDPLLEKAEDFRLGIWLGSRGYKLVIDRRIKGIHSKTYTLKSVLAEDWSRIQAMRSIKLNSIERRFSLKAHRINRLLSVAIPGPLLLTVLVAVVFLQVTAAWVALGLLVLFLLSNLRLLNYLKRWKGVWFASRAGFFLFVEMLWGQLALLRSLLSFHPVKGRAEAAD